MKLVTGTASRDVTLIVHKFKETASLPLMKQLETIQNQANWKAKAEKSQHPVQTVTLIEITSSDISLDICSYLKKK